MKAIIQRVSSASVTVDGQVVSGWLFSQLLLPQISSIGRGICVLVGLCREDNDEDTEYIVRKLLNLRLFECPEKGRRWDKSVKDLGLEVLSVSQFTLHARIKGNKLDFHHSMGADEAPNFYAKFMEKLRADYVPERVKVRKQLNFKNAAF